MNSPDSSSQQQNQEANEEIFGAFRLGDMSLALPMTVLREVVPLTDLQSMPTAASWVLGGLDLRGVLLPVIDLSMLLQRPETPEQRQCVVIVSLEGRLAGLVATAVDCLFSTPSDQIKLFHSQDIVGRVARGSLKNPVTGKLLSVLCAKAIMALPQLPSVADAEAHRQLQNATSSRHARAEATRIPLLLMRSHGLLFAVNPRDIETTMPRASLLPKDVCKGFYKGNAVYRDRETPAISLVEYLGMGTLELEKRNTGEQVKPAFVLRFDQGTLAVLIDEILDIVHVQPKHLMDLPRLGALQTSVLGQTIAQQSIYPHLPADEQHYYVIQPAGMQADTRLVELATLVHRAEETKRVPDGQSAEAQQQLRRQQSDQRVIVFDMKGDYAVPIGEIAEVLPYRGVKEAFSAGQAFRGVMTHRNRAIPVVDLAQHMGLPRQKMNTSCNVLVVHVDGQPIGLAVGFLRCIEQAQWSPQVPVLGAARTERPGVVRESQKLAEVMIANERKLLEVISALDEARRFLNAEQDGQQRASSADGLPGMDSPGGPMKAVVQVSATA